MALFDWLELGFSGSAFGGSDSTAVENFEKAFAGSFSATLGSSLSAFIAGGRHTHIYGDEFKFVLDWEAIEDKILHGLPLGLRAALLGLGGNATLVFGNDAALKYGQSTAVKRATSVDITGGPNFLAKLLSGGSIKDISPNPDPAAGTADAQKDADQSAGVAAGVFCSLMVLSSLAVELSLKIMTISPTAKWTSMGPAQSQSFLSSADWTLSSRLAAFAFAVEQSGYDTRKGLTSLDAAKNDLKLAKDRIEQVAKDSEDAVSDLETQVHVELANVKGKIYQSEGRIIKGAKETKAAADAAADALQQLARLTGAKSVSQDEAGNIGITSIQNLSLNAVNNLNATGQNNVFIRASGDSNDGNKGIVKVDATTGIQLSTNGSSSYLSLDSIEDTNIVTLGATGTGNTTVYAGSIDSGGRLFLSGSGAVLKLADNIQGPRISLTDSQIQIAIGPPAGGASITLTATSITLQVAEVSFKMTPTGITETVAEVTRSATMTGHTLAAAETSLAVAMTGVTITTPVINVNGDATLQLQGPMLTNSADGVLTVGGSLTNVGK